MLSHNFLSRVNDRSSAGKEESARSPHQEGDHAEPPAIVLNEETKEKRVEETGTKEKRVEETETKEKRVEETLTTRRNRVREMCKQFKVAEDVAYTVNRRHYYFFDYNATVCAVPKVRPRGHCREGNFVEMSYNKYIINVICGTVHL